MVYDYICKDQQEILGKSLQLAYKQQSCFILHSLESRPELRTNSLLFIFNNCILELRIWISLVHPLFSNNTYFKQPLSKLVSYNILGKWAQNENIAMENSLFHLNKYLQISSFMICFAIIVYKKKICMYSFVCASKLKIHLIFF